MWQRHKRRILLANAIFAGQIQPLLGARGAMISVAGSDNERTVRLTPAPLKKTEIPGNARQRERSGALLWRASPRAHAPTCLARRGEAIATILAGSRVPLCSDTGYERSCAAQCRGHTASRVLTSRGAPPTELSIPTPSAPTRVHLSGPAAWRPSPEILDVPDLSRKDVWSWVLRDWPSCHLFLTRFSSFRTHIISLAMSLGSSHNTDNFCIVYATSRLSVSR
ncbi:unnamed protein product [Peniophora sp. CBMAI 1063]|nr:unnamed protein product [Peniophora sp. CBMAI 1063]